MTARPTSQRQRRWLTSLLVVLFALRALVPMGFMPAGDGALALQVCPEGFPSALLAGHADHAAHHHTASNTPQGDPSHSADPAGGHKHDHKSWMSGHCAFGAAASGPALCHTLAIATVSHTEAARVDVTPVPVSLDHRFRIAQPRGPPGLV